MVTFTDIDNKSYQVPTSWLDVDWQRYKALLQLDSLKDQLQLLTGMVVDPEAMDGRLVYCLEFVKEAIEPYPAPKAVELMPFECWMNARSVLKSDPDNDLAFVRQYWPDTKPNADAVYSRYQTIIKAWQGLDQQFAILNTQMEAKERRAGFERLTVFGDYNIVADLAGGDITKENLILQLETKHTFMHRARMLMLKEVQDAYLKLK
jgi:hypothetical protein